MSFWFKFECQGIQKQAFGIECIAKINFPEIGFLMIPGSIFHDFGWP